MGKSAKAALILFVTLMVVIVPAELGIFHFVIRSESVTPHGGKETTIFMPRLYPLLEVPEFRKVYPDSEAVILPFQSLESLPIEFESSTKGLFELESPDPSSLEEIVGISESPFFHALDIAPSAFPGIRVVLFEPTMVVHNRVLYKECEVTGRYQWSTRFFLSSEENFFDITSAGWLEIEGSVKYYGLMSSEYATQLAQSEVRAAVESFVQEKLRSNWSELADGKYKNNLMQAGDWSKPVDLKKPPSSEELQQLDSLLSDENLSQDERLKRLRSLMTGHAEFLRWKDSMGATPLHKAIRSNQLEVVKWLLSVGAELEAVDNFRETPLHHAVKPRISKEITSLLLGSGADVAARNKNGETPLHHATFFDRIDQMALLLEAGADPRLVKDLVDAYADTPEKKALLEKFQHRAPVSKNISGQIR